MSEQPPACGHDPAQFVTSDEGTGYCPACEDEARSAASTRRYWTCANVKCGYRR